ncbi:MAG: hypothetical protein AAGI53_09940 [Planctomycetota bacterium]
MPGETRNRRGEGTPPASGAVVRWGVTASSLAVFVVGYLLGGSMVGLALGIVAGFLISGVWVGAAEQAAGFLAILVGLALSGVVGPLFEPALASVGGTGGVVARLATRAFAVALVAFPLATGLAFGFRALLKKAGVAKRWNSVAGACIGGVEGCVVALMILWIPVLLGPVAKVQVARVSPDAADQQNEDDSLFGPRRATKAPNLFAAAELVSSWEDALRASMLWGLAAATAPTQGTEMVVLASEFAKITRDDDAMMRLLGDPVMVEIGELESVQKALDRLRHENDVRAVIDGEPITQERLWVLLQSDPLLRAIEDTGAMDDLALRASDIADAIVRASEP